VGEIIIDELKRIINES